MKKSHLTFVTILLAIISIVLMAPAVSADCGPKPSVELHIENAPEGEYYVDLLQPYDELNSLDEESLEKYGLNPEMAKIMLNYSENGWYTRKGGVMDDIINKSNEIHFYQFTYNTPHTFKIILVTESLDIIVSDEVTPHSYNCVITFDVEKCLAEEKAVSEDISDSAADMLRMFVITVAITLVLEAIVFCCFSIKLNKKGKWAFIGTNIVTQLVLYISLIISPILYLPAEIVIPFIEARMMKKHMTEIKKSRRIACLITANVVSFIFGAPVIFALMYFRLI